MKERNVLIIDPNCDNSANYLPILEDNNYEWEVVPSVFKAWESLLLYGWRDYCGIIMGMELMENLEGVYERLLGGDIILKDMKRYKIKLPTFIYSGKVSKKYRTFPKEENESLFIIDSWNEKGIEKFKQFLSYVEGQL